MDTTITAPNPGAAPPEPFDFEIETPLEPELSTPAWSGPQPELEVDSDEGSGRSPLGLIVGGSALAALIAGLGVFTAFGAAGLAVAAAGTVAAAPAAAVGVADYRRRLRTGRWRPTDGRGARSSSEARGRLRRAMGGHGAGRASRSGVGRAGGVAGGQARRAGAAGSRGGGHGRSGLGRLLNGRQGRPSGAGRHAARSGGVPQRRAGHGVPGRLGRAMRGLGLGGRQRRNRTGGNGGLLSGSTGQFGRQLSRRGQRKAHRAAMRAQGFSRMGAYRAQRAERAQARRQMRYARADKRRQARWDRADRRREARREWLRKSHRAIGRRTWRVLRWPAVRVARTGVRTGRWMHRQTMRASATVWRRISRSRLRALGRRMRQAAVAAFLRVVAQIGRMIRTLVSRVPYWLGAPRTQRDTVPGVLIGEVVDDAHDDDRDTDAPPVARPGRRQQTGAAAPTGCGPLDSPAVRRPRRRGTSMSDGRALHPAWEAAVEAFRDHIGGYEMPEGQGEGIPDVDLFFGTAGDALREIAEVMNGLGDKFDGETPVEGEVADHWRDCGGGMNQMGDFADEVYGTWRLANEADLERHENPRPNEHLANV